MSGVTVKAVILAGGEGTRLRPLTSNQPKPMMPVANRPMMEHIVRLLAEHGFDDIVVTVAFLANHIRTYFGDGSDFGVRDAVRDRGLAARHRRLGAQRGRGARRDVPRHLGRRAHRHRPQRVRQGAPCDGCARLDRAEAGRGPGRVRHRDHGRGRLDRALPREADVGPGVLRHDQHRASTCSSPRCSTSSPRARSSTSRATCSRPRSRRASRCSATSSRATGRTSARSTRTCSAHQDILDGQVRVEIDGFRSGEDVWLGEGAEVDPDARVDGPGDHRGQLPDRGRRARARLHGARPRRRGEARRAGRALGRARAHVPRAVDAGARRGDRARSCDLRSHAAVEEGAVLGDECFVGEGAVVNPGVKVYPFKTVEAGAVVDVVDRVGEPPGAQRVRAPGRVRARQRRHHARARDAARAGLRHVAEEGRGRHHEPRHEPRSPARSSGRSSAG